MENENNSPYQDPDLIRDSRGDEQLLNRLVARKIAADQLYENPDDDSLQRLHADMDQSVWQRQDELGISREDLDLSADED